MSTAPVPPVVFAAESGEELIFVHKDGRFTVIYSADGATFYVAAPYNPQYAAPGAYLQIYVPDLGIRNKSFHWHHEYVVSSDGTERLHPDRASDMDGNQLYHTDHTKFNGEAIPLPAVVPGQIFFAKDGFNWHYLAFTNVRNGRLHVFTMLRDPTRPGEFSADEQEYGDTMVINGREVHFTAKGSRFILGGKDLVGVQQPSSRDDEPLTNLEIDGYDFEVSTDDKGRVSIRLKPKQVEAVQPQ